VVDKIRRQNEASPFLNEFIRKQGFAVWDKTTVKHVANSVAIKASRTAGDSAELVIIPLVRANENHVHGALACTVIDDSVTIRLLDGSKYNWYSQHPEIIGNNGEQLSLMLMQLDKTVFGHELFKITDPTAFGPKTGKKPRYIKLLSTQGKAANQRWTIETITVTYVTYEDQFEGQLHGCAPGPDCFEYNAVTHTIVYQHYIWVDDGTPYPSPDPWYDPNGGGGGTGGGGSNGNEETPWLPVGGQFDFVQSHSHLCGTYNWGTIGEAWYTRLQSVGFSLVNTNGQILTFTWYQPCVQLSKVTASTTAQANQAWNEAWNQAADRVLQDFNNGGPVAD
jgi:hypothetical protein